MRGFFVSSSILRYSIQTNFWALVFPIWVSRIFCLNVYGLIMFMASPFSFSQAVFFQRETANPINQEARVLDFLAIGLLLPRNNFLSMHIRLNLCTMPYRNDKVVTTLSEACRGEGRGQGCRKMFSDPWELLTVSSIWPLVVLSPQSMLVKGQTAPPNLGS